MTTLLPWVAALSSAVLFLYRVGVSGKDILDRIKSNLIPALIPIVLSLAGWGISLRYHGKFDGLNFLCIGSLFGSIALFAVFAASSEERPKWNVLYSILFPAAALAATHWLKTPDAISMAQNGLAAGAALTALMLCVGKEQSFHSSCLPGAAVMGALVLANRIGRDTDVHAAAMTGLLLGIAAALGIFASLCLFNRDDQDNSSFRRFATMAFTAIVIVFGGYLAARKLIGYSNVTLITLGAVLLALFTHWLIEADKENSLRFGIAAAIWVAAATLAFAERKAYGMATMAAVGTLMLVSLGSPRALLSMGPAIGLVFYRMFRNEYPEASRALDLGQHYAIVGMLLGLMLALIVAQWFASSSNKMVGKGYWGGLVWIVLMVMIPLVASVLLGPKGVTGYVVGLGVAAFIEGFRGEASLLPLICGTALAFLFTAAYGWVGDIELLTRAEKTSTIIRYGLDIVGLGIILALLSSTRKRSEL